MNSSNLLLPYVWVNKVVREVEGNTFIASNYGGVGTTGGTGISGSAPGGGSSVRISVPGYEIVKDDARPVEPIAPRVAGFPELDFESHGTKRS